MATLIIRPQFPDLLLRFITRDYNTDEVGSQHDQFLIKVARGHDVW